VGWPVHGWCSVGQFQYRTRRGTGAHGQRRSAAWKRLVKLGYREEQAKTGRHHVIMHTAAPLQAETLLWNGGQHRCTRALRCTCGSAAVSRISVMTLLERGGVTGTDERQTGSTFGATVLLRTAPH
jgi:hypothetical protein